MAYIEVLVKHKETGDERVITYRAYQDASYHFELIGQVNEKGELIPGSPNLQPQHQEKRENVAQPVVRSGQTYEEKLQQKEELMARFAPPKIQVHETIPPVDEAPVVEKKKRGPKPKLQEA